MYVHKDIHTTETLYIVILYIDALLLRERRVIFDIKKQLDLEPVRCCNCNSYKNIKIAHVCNKNQLYVHVSYHKQRGKCNLRNIAFIVDKQLKSDSKACDFLDHILQSTANMTLDIFF